MSAKKILETYDAIGKLKGCLDYKAGRTFTVLLRCGGDTDGHTYLGGIFSTYRKACYEAKCCMALRAGKYDAEIYESYLDSGAIKIYRVIHWGDFDPTKFGY